MTEDTLGLNNVITIDDERIKSHLDRAERPNRERGNLLRLAWHGPLPDFARERDSMRPKAGHSMIQIGRSAHAAQTLQA